MLLRRRLRFNGGGRKKRKCMVLKVATLKGYYFRTSSLRGKTKRILTTQKNRLGSGSTYRYKREK